MRKALGLLAIFMAVVSLVINFSLYHFWIFENFSGIFSLVPYWLSNPVSLLTSNVAGHIWLISDALTVIVNAFTALFYSGLLLVIGIVLVK